MANQGILTGMMADPNSRLNTTVQDIVQPFVDTYSQAISGPMPQPSGQQIQRYTPWERLTPDEQNQWQMILDKRTRPSNAMQGLHPELAYTQYAGMAAQYPNWIAQNHPDIANWLAAVSNRSHK